MDTVRTTLTLTAVAAVFAAPLVAQPHYLVADLNQLPIDAGSTPDHFVVFGGAVYFTASDDMHGEELWRSDGTEAGTYRVRDICPGRCSSQPLALTEAGGRLYFLAYSGTTGPYDDTGTKGTELWRTDGTAAGTELVRTVCTTECYTSLVEMVAVDGILYFAGTDADHGRELWRSDGTAAGTGLLRDIQPGPSGTPIAHLVALDGQLLFRADDGVSGYELWRSDGTTLGTELLKDVCPGACSSNPQEMGRLFDDVVTFAADDGAHGEELWVSDGTAAGTVRATELPGPFLAIDDVVRFGNRVYFATRGSNAFPRGWKTDGTLAGTEPAPELLPLGPGLLPTQLRVAGDRLFFTIRPSFPSEEIQLWATDGSVPGTEMLAAFSSATTLGTVLGDRLVFGVYTSFNATGDLWISDGTPQGTEQLDEATPYALNFRFQRTAVLGGEMFFGADGGATGFELWTTDGSPDGTGLLRQLAPPRASSFPDRMAAFDGRLFFNTTPGVPAQRRLWRSDGTEAGTEIVEPQLVTGQPLQAGGRLFFEGIDPSSSQRSVWVTDGTPEAAVPVAGPQDPRQLIAHGDLLFWAVSDPGQQIWRSDGDPARTVLVEDVHPGWYTCPFPCIPPVILPDQLTFSGPLVYFVALEDDVYQLWRTDGSEAGTLALADFGIYYDDYPTYLTDLDGTLVFSAFDAAAGQEPWISDGTPRGTRRLADLAPGAASSDPRRLTRAGDRVYFLVAGDDRLDSLWATDGTPGGTVPVAELRIRGRGSRGGFLAAAGKRLFFTAENPMTGEELWVSDGTAAGTHLVTDLLPGPIGSRPRHLTAAGGEVLFAADDGVHGQEVWLSDGTAVGTRLVADVAPGLDASDPVDFTVVGGRVYFAAGDVELGRELFAFDGSAAGLCLGQLCPASGATPEERGAAIVKRRR